MSRLRTDSEEKVTECRRAWDHRRMAEVVPSQAIGLGQKAVLGRPKPESSVDEGETMFGGGRRETRAGGEGALSGCVNRTESFQERTLRCVNPCVLGELEQL